MSELNKHSETLDFQTEIISFLEWAYGTHGYELQDTSGNCATPILEKSGQLVAEYFGIDLQKLEEERRDLVRSLEESLHDTEESEV